MSLVPVQSYSKQLLGIKDHTQKLYLTHIYYPFLSRHYLFEHKWEQANAANGNAPLSATTLPLYLEALGEFDFYLLRNFINDVPSTFSKLLLNETQNRKFFASGHQDVLPIFNSFAPGTSEIQWARNSLQSFTRLLLNDFAEMEKAWRYIESVVSQSQDTASNIRGGMAGGSIGGIVGSIVFPGVGTLVGAALGGYLMQKSRTDGYCEKITQHLILYYEHVRHLISVLQANAREIYMILGKMFDTMMTERLRNTYKAIKVRNGEADLFMIDYLNMEELSIENNYAQRFDERFEASTADAVGYVEWFLASESSS